MSGYFGRAVDGLAPVAKTPELIARQIQGLPLTIETQQVDVEVEVDA